MGTKRPLPPSPPGEGSAIWQQWVNILQPIAAAAAQEKTDVTFTKVTSTGDVVVDGQLNVTGISTLAGVVTAESTLHVEGALTADTTLAVGGSANLTGAVSAHSSLAVTGNLTGSSTLAIAGAVGFNGASPQGKLTLPAAATDLPTTLTLLNAIRALLIANGQAQ